MTIQRRALGTNDVLLDILYAGSMIGGIAETQEVIDHCFARKIYPDVEMIKSDQIDVAYQRVIGKGVRFRFVIDLTSTR